MTAARFCARCGQALASSGDSMAARVLHPNPLARPDDFQECGDAAHLYYRWEAAWGGLPLLNTESLGLVLLNGGYSLQSVILRVRGRDSAANEVFSIEPLVEALPRGLEVKVEIPSYELPAPARELDVSLVSAEFGAEGP